MPKATVAQLKTQPEFITYESDIGKAARIRIIVDGVFALLTHNPESMSTMADAMRGGRVPDPEIEAEAGTYRMADGTCALRGESFRATTLAAGGAWRMKKSSARARLAHMIVVEELVQLRLRDGTPISEYAIDARRAIVQRQGIIRRRPRYDEWSCTFTIEYDPVLVPDPKLIVDILQDAGGRIGVGDYRPQKNGWFGRFRVRAYQLPD